jgi:hypothetical protein
MADDLPQAKVFFGMALEQAAAAAGLREGVVRARDALRWLDRVGRAGGKWALLRSFRVPSASFLAVLLVLTTLTNGFVRRTSRVAMLLLGATSESCHDMTSERMHAISRQCLTCWERPVG